MLVVTLGKVSIRLFGLKSRLTVFPNFSTNEENEIQETTLRVTGVPKIRSKCCAIPRVRVRVTL